MIPTCLTLSIIRYLSRVKWSNPGKGVASSPTPQYSSYSKGSFQVTLNYGRQLYFTLYIYIYMCVCVCVCVCIYIYIYTHTLMYTHTHTHTYIYIYIYIHANKCASVSLCVYFGWFYDMSSLAILFLLLYGFK